MSGGLDSQYDVFVDKMKKQEESWLKIIETAKPFYEKYSEYKFKYDELNGVLDVLTRTEDKAGIITSIANVVRTPASNLKRIGKNIWQGNDVYYYNKKIRDCVETIEDKLEDSETTLANYETLSKNNNNNKFKYAIQISVLKSNITTLKAILLQLNNKIKFIDTTGNLEEIKTGLQYITLDGKEYGIASTAGRLLSPTTPAQKTLEATRRDNLDGLKKSYNEEKIKFENVVNQFNNNFDTTQQDTQKAITDLTSDTDVANADVLKKAMEKYWGMIYLIINLKYYNKTNADASFNWSNYIENRRSQGSFVNNARFLKIIANLFPKTIYYSDASIKIDNFEQFYSKMNMLYNYDDASAVDTNKIPLVNYASIFDDEEDFSYLNDELNNTYEKLTDDSHYLCGLIIQILTDPAIAAVFSIQDNYNATIIAAGNLQRIMPAWTAAITPANFIALIPNAVRLRFKQIDDAAAAAAPPAPTADGVAQANNGANNALRQKRNILVNILTIHDPTRNALCPAAAPFAPYDALRKYLPNLPGAAPVAANSIRVIQRAIAYASYPDNQLYKMMIALFTDDLIAGQIISVDAVYQAFRTAFNTGMSTAGPDDFVLPAALPANIAEFLNFIPYTILKQYDNKYVLSNAAVVTNAINLKRDFISTILQDAAIRPVIFPAAAGGNPGIENAYNQLRTFIKGLPNPVGNFLAVDNPENNAAIVQAVQNAFPLTTIVEYNTDGKLAACIPLGGNSVYIVETTSGNDVSKYGKIIKRINFASYETARVIRFCNDTYNADVDETTDVNILVGFYTFGVAGANNIKLYDRMTGLIIYEKMVENLLVDIQMNGNKEQFIVANNTIVSIRDTSIGDSILSSTGAPIADVNPGQAISNIAFSPDGQIILISYTTNFVGFALNDDVTAFDIIGAAVNAGAVITNLKYCPDEANPHFIVSYGNNIQASKINDTRTAYDPIGAAVDARGPINCISYSADGKHFVVGLRLQGVTNPATNNLKIYNSAINDAVPVAPILYSEFPVVVSNLVPAFPLDKYITSIAYNTTLFIAQSNFRTRFQIVNPSNAGPQNIPTLAGIKTISYTPNFGGPDDNNDNALVSVVTTAAPENIDIYKYSSLLASIGAPRAAGPRAATIATLTIGGGCNFDSVVFDNNNANIDTNVVAYCNRNIYVWTQMQPPVSLTFAPDIGDGTINSISYNSANTTSSGTDVKNALATLISENATLLGAFNNIPDVNYRLPIITAIAGQALVAAPTNAAVDAKTLIATQIITNANYKKLWPLFFPGNEFKTLTRESDLTTLFGFLTAENLLRAIIYFRDDIVGPTIKTDAAKTTAWNNAATSIATLIATTPALLTAFNKNRMAPFTDRDVAAITTEINDGTKLMHAFAPVYTKDDILSKLTKANVLAFFTSRTTTSPYNIEAIVTNGFLKNAISASLFTSNSLANITNASDVLFTSSEIAAAPGQSIEIPKNAAKKDVQSGINISGLNDAKKYIPLLDDEAKFAGVLSKPEPEASGMLGNVASALTEGTSNAFRQFRNLLPGPDVLPAAKDGQVKKYNIASTLFNNESFRNAFVNSIFVPGYILVGQGKSAGLGIFTDKYEVTEANKLTFDQDVNAITFSSDGTTGIVGCDEGFIYSFNINKKLITSVYSYNGTKSNVTSVKFLDDAGLQFICGYEDGTISVWDNKSKTETTNNKTIAPSGKVSLSLKIGGTAVNSISVSNQKIVATCSNAIKAFNFANNAFSGETNATIQNIQYVSLIDATSLLIMIGGALRVMNNNLGNATQVGALSVETPVPAIDSNILSFTYNKDGSKMILGLQNNTIGIYDTKTRMIIGKPITLNFPQQTKNNYVNPTIIKISPSTEGNEQFIVGYGEYISIYDLDKKEPVVFKKSNKTNTARISNVNNILKIPATAVGVSNIKDIIFNSDGSKFCVLFGNTINIYDAKNGDIIKTIPITQTLYNIDYSGSQIVVSTGPNIQFYKTDVTNPPLTIEVGAQKVAVPLGPRQREIPLVPVADVTTFAYNKDNTAIAVGLNRVGQVSVQPSIDIPDFTYQMSLRIDIDNLNTENIFVYNSKVVTDRDEPLFRMVAVGGPVSEIMYSPDNLLIAAIVNNKNNYPPMLRVAAYLYKYANYFAASANFKAEVVAFLNGSTNTRKVFYIATANAKKDAPDASAAAVDADLEQREYIEQLATIPLFIYRLAFGSDIQRNAVPPAAAFVLQPFITRVREQMIVVLNANAPDGPTLGLVVPADYALIAWTNSLIIENITRQEVTDISKKLQYQGKQNVDYFYSQLASETPLSAGNKKTMYDLWMTDPKLDDANAKQEGVSKSKGKLGMSTRTINSYIVGLRYFYIASIQVDYDIIGMHNVQIFDASTGNYNNSYETENTNNMSYNMTLNPSTAVVIDTEIITIKDNSRSIDVARWDKLQNQMQTTYNQDYQAISDDKIYKGNANATIDLDIYSNLFNSFQKNLNYFSWMKPFYQTESPIGIESRIISLLKEYIAFDPNINDDKLSEMLNEYNDKLFADKQQLNINKNPKKALYISSQFDDLNFMIGGRKRIIVNTNNQLPNPLKLSLEDFPVVSNEAKSYTGTYIRTYVYWKAGNRLALGGPGKSYECTPHGYGVMNYLIKDEKMNNPELTSYRGFWRNGDYHGYGELCQGRISEGDTNVAYMYRAFWKNGNLNGPGIEYDGTSVWNNKIIYVGNFEDNKRSGNGIWLKAYDSSNKSGSIYSGYFVENQLGWVNDDFTTRKPVRIQTFADGKLVSYYDGLATLKKDGTNGEYVPDGEGKLIKFSEDGKTAKEEAAGNFLEGNLTGKNNTLTTIDTDGTHTKQTGAFIDGKQVSGKTEVKAQSDANFTPKETIEETQEVKAQLEQIDTKLEDQKVSQENTRIAIKKSLGKDVGASLTPLKTSAEIKAEEDAKKAEIEKRSTETKKSIDADTQAFKTAKLIQIGQYVKLSDSMNENYKPDNNAIVIFANDTKYIGPAQKNGSVILISNLYGRLESKEGNVKIPPGKEASYWANVVIVDGKKYDDEHPLPPQWTEYRPYAIFDIIPKDSVVASMFNQKVTDAMFSTSEMDKSFIGDEKTLKSVSEILYRDIVIYVQAYIMVLKKILGPNTPKLDADGNPIGPCGQTAGGQKMIAAQSEIDAAQAQLATANQKLTAATSSNDDAAKTAANEEIGKANVLLSGANDKLKDATAEEEPQTTTTTTTTTTAKEPEVANKSPEVAKEAPKIIEETPKIVDNPTAALEKESDLGGEIKTTATADANANVDVSKDELAALRLQIEEDNKEIARLKQEREEVQRTTASVSATSQSSEETTGTTGTTGTTEAKDEPPKNDYDAFMQEMFINLTTENSGYEQFKQENKDAIQDLDTTNPEFIQNVLNAIITSVSPEAKNLLNTNSIGKYSLDQVLLIINKNIIILFSMYLIVVSKLPIKNPFLVLNLYNGFRTAYDKAYKLILEKGATDNLDIEETSAQIFDNETTNAFIKSILALLAFSVTAGGVTAATSGMFSMGGKRYTRRKKVVKRQYNTKRDRKLNLKGKKYVTRKLRRKKRVRKNKDRK
jgi:WD40 repeat protein